MQPSTAFGLLCICLLFAMAFSLPFSAFSEPFFGTENVTDIQKRAENQFIMTGYQPISFRSDDCNISLPGSREPYVLTIVNWYAMYWVFEGKNSEKMHMVVEAETRGWVGIAFGGTSTTSGPADAVVGWIRKSEKGAAHDVSHIGSYTLAAGWDDISNPANDNSKKVALESASVCQTRDGRTVLRFTRKVNAGRFPLRTTANGYQMAFMAVGKHDGFSPALDSTYLSWSVMQGRPDAEPESDFWSDLYKTLLIIFYVFSWFIR